MEKKMDYRPVCSKCGWRAPRPGELGKECQSPGCNGQMVEPQLPVKKAKPQSRPQRWSAAATAAQGAIDDIRMSNERLVTALEELKSLQDEYQEWRDNLPENLQQSAIGEKLDEICGLDIDSQTEGVENTLSEIESVVSDAESAELPQGFGRD